LTRWNMECPPKCPNAGFEFVLRHSWPVLSCAPPACRSGVPADRTILTLDACAAAWRPRAPGTAAGIDLLFLNGQSTALLPLIERKERLHRLFRKEIPGLRYSQHVTGNGQGARSKSQVNTYTPQLARRHVLRSDNYCSWGRRRAALPRTQCPKWLDHDVSHQRGGNHHRGDSYSRARYWIRSHMDVTRISQIQLETR
jgi:hypothetical protein